METLEERRLLSAPIVTGPADRFQWNVGPQTIDFTFDQNTLVSDPTVQLTNLTTGADGTGWLTRTSADDTATLDFRIDHTDQSGISHSLDRGNYDLYLNASQVSNGDGEVMAADDLSSFFFQPGDINHDRTVDQTDYNTMSNNVPTFGATYSQGDVNYDGYIGDDEDALIQWFGVTLQPPPDAPNTLRASGGPGLIDLDWQAPGEPANPNYYGIWRSSDGGETFSFLIDTDGPVTNYEDSGLPDGAKFMYQVRAHTDAGGYSLATNKFWAVTCLPGPTNAPVVTNLSATGLTLTWDDVTTNETGFQINAIDSYDVPHIFEAPAHDGSGSATYDLTTLTPGMTYQIEVRSKTDAQVSTWSPPITGVATDLVGAMANGVDPRIAGKTTAALPLYSTQDHANGIYVRSTASWMADVTNLSSISPWNSWDGPSGAGTLVSPRHIVMAEHWGYGPGTIVRFVAPDNTVVARTVVATQAVGPWNSQDNYATGVVVGLLDSDVPSTISFAKVMPPTFRSHIHDNPSRPVPLVVLDQEEKGLVSDFFDSPNRIYWTAPSAPQRNLLYEPMVNGDSGDPVFALVGSELVLLTTVTGQASQDSPFFLGPDYPAITDQINSAMASLGGGYQLTTFDLSAYPTYS